MWMVVWLWPASLFDAANFGCGAWEWGNIRRSRNSPQSVVLGPWDLGTVGRDGHLAQDRVNRNRIPRTRSSLLDIVQRNILVSK